ncbi:MAG: hypothetical protein JNM18_11315 [Planctomycetaceae bacterium]|nr:hypothetical protein [Planctomycetaceae bacterium]
MQKHRTMILAAGLIVSLIAVGCGDTLVELFTQPLAERRAKLQKLTAAIERQHQQVSVLQQNNLQIDKWRERSLPADASRATTMYQHWLLDQLRQLDLNHPVVTPGNPILRADHQIIPFQVETEATLENCVALLARIENAPIQHSVKRFQVQPANREGGELLRVVLQIEALSLTCAMRHPQRKEVSVLSKSSEGVADLPPVTTLAKNPFLPHRPEIAVAVNSVPDPVVEATPSSEPAAATKAEPVLRLIGVIDQAGKKEAWLFDAQTKQHLVVYEQQPVPISTGTINITRISAQSIDIVHGTQAQTVQLGQSLASPAPATTSPFSLILGALQIQ